MHYQPPRALGLIIGALLALWSGSIAFLLLNEGITGNNDLMGFAAYASGIVALALASLFSYWTYALATLAYSIDRNGLVIQWGLTRQIVPLQEIERLVPGSASPLPRVRGVSWWGNHIGSAEVTRIGDVLFYSTHQQPEQVLYVMTAHRNYAISVPDPAAFAAEVQTRQDLGPTALVAPHVERSGAALQSLFADPWARSLAFAAIAGAVLVWVQTALRYNGLPEALTLQWPPTVDRSIVTVTARDAILELPRAGTLMLALNLVAGVLLHAWDRTAGYLLLGMGVLVQVGLFAAMVLALR